MRGRPACKAGSYAVHRRWTGADAIYLHPLVPLSPAGGDRSRDIGDAVQLDGAWQVNRKLKLQVELVRQEAGSAVRALGGRAVDLAVLFEQVRF